MSPAVSNTKLQGRGPGHLSDGGHTEGSGVRNAPVWHNRGFAANHRSVRCMAEMGAPSLCHLGKNWRGRQSPACL